MYVQSAKVQINNGTFQSADVKVIASLIKVSIP